MGVALERTGINTDSFTGQRCWYGHSPGHILRAQELADWINRKPDLFGERTIYKKKTSADFKHKKGIVFIQDGWGPTDHIDVWDSSYNQMKGGYSEYFERGEIWFWEF